MKQTLSAQKPVKKKFKIFWLSNAIWINLTGLLGVGENVSKSQQKKRVTDYSFYI